MSSEEIKLGSRFRFARGGRAKSAVVIIGVQGTAVGRCGKGQVVDRDKVKATWIHTRRVGLGHHLVDELAAEQRIERRKDFVKEDFAGRRLNNRSISTSYSNK
jgi:hypothetical protein